MRARALWAAAIALSVIDVEQAASADGPAIKWWPGVVTTTGISGVQGTAQPPAVWSWAQTMTDDPRKYGIANMSMGESNNNQACAFKAHTGKLDPSATNEGGYKWTDNCEYASYKDVVLPAGEFVSGVSVCTNGETGDGVALKGIQLRSVKIGPTGELTPGNGVQVMQTNCKTWFNPVYCDAGSIATSLVLHTGKRGVRGIGLVCHPVYREDREPPKFTAQVGVASFDPTTPKVKVHVTLKNQWGSNVNGWSAKVSVRGNGRPGAGVCSTTLAGSSSTLTTQESDVEMPCTWAQITTTPGCEAMNTPNPQNNQYCNAPIDVTAEHLDANRTATLNRSGYVVQ